MSNPKARDVLVVDRGPVRNAAVILARQSTLADHVVVLDGQSTTIEIAEDSVPFGLWGSGTQALWRLLSAIAYPSETVSLYEVAAYCDSANRATAAHAIAELLKPQPVRGTEIY